ncbi:hypothetical protein [Nocardia fusca]|uniref:DUF222 domain-containing protein n=1 Tax=Nocardia fusca TaxID=941183 RepID=A0ABV3FJX4_9NOCA
MTTVSTEDLYRWLTAGAALGDRTFHAGAIELLNFAGLLDRADVRRYIQTETVPDREGNDVDGAWVDWAALARSVEDGEIGALYGGQDRLLRLALSIAHGTLVDLSATLSGLGHAHARAVLDAMTAPLGLAGDVEITYTAAYLERKRADDDRVRQFLGAHGLDPDDTVSRS